MVGQEWRVTYPEDPQEDADYFVMLPGGALTWTIWFTGGDRWQEHNNSTWTVDGTDVTFEVNDGYATFRGNLANGRVTGTAHQRDGRTFTWVATPRSGDRVR